MQQDNGVPRQAGYFDFEIEIGQGIGREYPVTVRNSPAGEADETMYFPFSELALDSRLGKLQIALLRSGGKHRRVSTREEQAIQDFGRALFDALFSGRVRTCYDVSLREAAQQDCGLRLKLRIRPPELNALPWEFLYDPDQAEYVCLSRQTPIVRYLHSPRLIKPLSVRPPLRILGMVASPEDLAELDIEREKTRVERATRGLRDRGLLELAWLPGQTWRDLQEAMWGGPWHIFHFIGHGGFDAQTDEGFISLMDRAGRRNPLSATRLGRLLADHRALRLVLLNACEGAKGSERDIYSSTASILVRRGIPAVVAMQYEITDRAAIEFARAFYRALAYGLAVDEAVVAARKAIDLAVTNTVEWGTPVLYMRTPDGVLFHLTSDQQEQPPAPEAHPDLDQLTRRAVEEMDAQHWAEARQLLVRVEEQEPGYGETERLLVMVDSKIEEAAAERQKQGQISALYEEAQNLARARQWRQVLTTMGQLHALDPQFPDPEGLVARAQQGNESEDKDAQWQSAALYIEALHSLRLGQYQDALTKIGQVQALDPQFSDPEEIAAQAQAGLAENRDRGRQAQLAALYQDSHRLVRAHQWQQALAKMNEILILDPKFDDPDGLLATARHGASAEERRSKKLEELYKHAVWMMNNGRWAEAQRLFLQVQELQPGYRQTERYLTRLAKGL